MKRIPIDEAKNSLKELINYVNASKDTVILSNPDGTEVRLVPVPKPIEFWKGRPVYHIDDLQFLSKEEFPYPPEPLDD